LRDSEPLWSTSGTNGNRVTPLTTQETAILAASATGRTVGEVAKFLGYPRETVLQCLATAIQKLGARSKLEAVVIALRRGLIDVP
jgi:DNA-binding NarL/FixJ family response regulator